MANSNSLDPIIIPNQHIPFVFLYIDSELKDPIYYLNSILDRPHSRISGSPLRFATENDLFTRIIKQEFFIHVSIAEAFNSKQNSILKSYLKMNFEIVIEEMFNMMGMRIPNIEKVVPYLEIQTFTVESINLCCYIFFFPTRIKTSSIITCPKCRTNYDLGKDSIIITDEDLEQYNIETGRQTIKVHNHRYPDLIMKVKIFNDVLILKTISRVTDLRNDPTIRWYCKECRDTENGYPGSFIMHEFKG